MRTFFHCLHMDLNRAIFSLWFLVACVLVVAVCIIASFDEIIQTQSGAMMVFSYVQYSPIVNTMLLAICVLPGATLFCADWDNRNFRPLALRTGMRVYGISKASACAIAAICTELFGKITFFLILAVRFPILARPDYTGKNITIGGTPLKAFEPLFNQHQYLLYFILCELLIALLCAFFAEIALWISAVLPNMFVIVASPIIIYYLLDQILYYVGMPIWLNPFAVKGGFAAFGGPLQSFLYALAFFIVLCALFGWLFVRKARGRIQNG